MQKKIIALAIAGLASTAAFAQTNVTVYGIVDYGMSYRFDSLNGTGVNGSNNADSRVMLNGSQQSGNRIGFKGTEDLGNGLKAIFLTEHSFGGDSQELSTDSNNNALSNRQTYVGLTGGFGTLIGGRLYTPHYTFVSGLDPFAAGTVGRYNNTYSPTANTFGGLFDPVRVDNAVAYVSPNFGGVTVTAAYSNNAANAITAVNVATGANTVAGDATNDSTNNSRVYAVLGEYKAGMFTAGVSYHFIDVANSLKATAETVQTVVLGGSVDLGMAKIAGFASYGTADNSVGGDADLYNYMLGVTVPVGKVSIKGSLNYSDYDAKASSVALATNDSVYQVAIGADYAFSKRTNLYTAYSFIDNDENLARTNRTAVVGDAGNAGGVFQQGLQVGVRHQF